MLTISSVILYGGLLFYVAIAQKWDLAQWFHRFKLSFVVTIWQKGPEGRLMVIAGTIALLLIIEALIVGIGGGAGPPEPPPQGEWVPQMGSTTVSRYSAEGQGEVATPNLPDLNLVAANLTLTWNDNDVTGPGPGVTPIAPVNEPDTLGVIVTLPDGTQISRGGSNSGSGEGSVSLQVPQPIDGNITDWEIVVECTEAGDLVGRFGRVWAVDGGNAWDLEIEYTYLEWVVPEE